jgi:2-phosphosulfolactate phosphatase
LYFDQREYDIRFEWGLSGVKALAPISDVVIIVDVLSFTTCVDLVVGNRGIVFPYKGEAQHLAGYAKSVGAVYATRERDAVYSLSPSKLANIPAETRLVLPSPNGSTLSLATGEVQTIAGCLRNAEAVAAKAVRLGKRIAVIAAGEQWWGEGTLRPGVEDLLGAGAIIANLKGRLSPEAELTLTAFKNAQANLKELLFRCGSGKELIGKGFEEDVVLAAELNVSSVAPLLTNGAYQNAAL